MSEYIIGRLNSEGIKVEKDVAGNIYATKGDADVFPCLVSHIDTVHKIVPQENYKVVEADNKAFAINPVTMEFTGVGGDDKCGIYICIELLKKLDNVKAAFFVDEEVGCVGSSRADLSFFSNVGYLIQADRKGYADVVSNVSGLQVASGDFMHLIKPVMDNYLKKECKNGGLTDIHELKRSGVDVCAINLSCGYYNPHRNNEYIDLSELDFTLQFVEDIISVLGEVKYPQVAENTMQYNKYGYGYGRYGNIYYDDFSFSKPKKSKKKKTPYVSQPVVSIDEDPTHCDTCGTDDIYVGSGYVYCRECKKTEYNYKSEDYATVKNNL
jgi:hypothetical protein